MTATGGDYGVYEARSRLNLFLPAGNVRERVAVDGALTLLRAQYGGLTNSSLRPTAFDGWYWDKENEQWVRDPIVLVSIDTKYRIDDPELDLDAELIRLEIADLYVRQNARQLSLWITVEGILRVLEPNGEAPS